MTRAMLAVAQSAAPGAGFVGWTSAKGPPAIQGRADGEAAGPPLLELVDQAAHEGMTGIVVGCFDDTALAAAQSRAPCPVIGIGQAGFHLCALRGWRFSVVTTLSVSVPIIEENVSRYGFGTHLGRVRASEIPVLALEKDPAAATRIIETEALRAVTEDGVDAIVLGCAGMAGLTAHLRAALPVPVVDGVEAAARLIGSI